MIRLNQWFSNCGAGPLLGCVYFFGWGVLEGQIIIIFVVTVKRIHRFVFWFHFSILKNNSVLNKIHTPYTHLPIIASLKYCHSCVGQDPPTEKWLPALQERRRINFRVKLSLSPTVTHALCFVFFCSYLYPPAAPGWGSCSLGVFICLACSGIHRNIPEISKVKSLSLSRWEDQEMEVDVFFFFFYSASHQYMD